MTPKQNQLIQFFNKWGEIIVVPILLYIVQKFGFTGMKQYLVLSGASAIIFYGIRPALIKPNQVQNAFMLILNKSFYGVSFGLTMVAWLLGKQYVFKYFPF